MAAVIWKRLKVKPSYSLLYWQEATHWARMSSLQLTEYRSESVHLAQNVTYDIKKNDSEETSSSKVVSALKGVFNNEGAIGSLAVAKQPHQHHSLSSQGALSRFKGWDVQWYFSMWEKCVIYQCMRWGVSYLLLYCRFWWIQWWTTFSGPQCHCCCDWITYRQ